ncbi:MAG: cell division protein FtsQ/DivIB [Alphaproteobacteria bacterium]|nr:cell division protein FtsQ/DivIB [Alphaproteobacteria bacterium]
MKRSIWFWLCFIIAIVLAIYFSVRIIMTGTGHGKLSLVRNISISADIKNADLSGLATVATIAPGTHSYSVDLNAMNARVGAIPGVRKSAVRRMPNGNISVEVSLYQAVALWTDGENYFPLSGDGTIVNKPTDTRDTGNIVFRGKLPNDISEITRVARNLIGDLDYLEWIEDRRWNLHTTSGITVMLPETDPISAVTSLISLNKNHNILHKDITVIDMRDSARTYVK